MKNKIVPLFNGHSFIRKYLSGFIFIILFFSCDRPYSQVIYNYDFGTVTGSYSAAGSTIALAPPVSGNAYLYIASTPNGGAQLNNPGLNTFGSGTKLMLHSSASGGSANKFSIWGYSGGNTSYCKFTVVLADSTGGSTPVNGIFYFCSGSGTSFRNNNGLSPGEILTGIKWSVSSEGTISTKTIKSGNAWEDILLNPFYQGNANVYTIEIFGNNSIAAVNYNYNYIPHSVAPLKQDIHINGTLCADDADVSGNGLVQGAAINSIMFYVEENSASRLCAFIDDVSFQTAIPPTTTTYIDYYSRPAGNLELLTTWTSNLDGSGNEHPFDFNGGANGTNTMNFHLTNRSAATIGNNWSISGQNCKLIVGSGTGECTLSIPVSSSFSSTNTEISSLGVIDNHNTSGTFGSFRVLPGGKYIHNINGGTIPAGIWDSNSTCLVSGITSSAPAGLGQSFYNFIWNSPGQSQGINLNLPAGFVITGDLTISNTGSVPGRTLQLINTTDRNVMINGSLFLNGGSLSLSSGTGSIELTVNGNTALSNGSELYLNQSGSGSGRLKIYSDLSVNSGSLITSTGSSGEDSIVFSNDGIQNFSNSGLVQNINYRVNTNSNLVINNDLPVSSGRIFSLSGLLLLGTYNITGEGNFVLNSGGTLGIGSPDGITISGPSGNIQNSGTRVFSSQGNYVYNGFASQVTGAGLPPVISNLQIDNSYGITLSSNTTVNGTLNLAEGVIDLIDNNLEIGPEGTITNYSAANYVKTSGSGVLRRLAAAENTLFPVGNGTYTPVILNNSGITDIFSVKVKNTFDNTPLNNLVVNKQWSISGDINRGSDITVTFQWNAADESGLFNRSSNVYIGGWDGAGWQSFYGGSGYTGPGPYTVTSDSIRVLSDFIIANESALPVNMAYFRSSVKKNAVILNWGTSCELNNAGFEIYRKADSPDGSWACTGFIEGKGTTNTVTDYTFTDKNLSKGKYKYRLKQKDLNGNFEIFYLNSSVEIGVPAAYSLSQNFPNPFNPATNISFEIPVNGLVKLVIYDMLGKEIGVLVNEIKEAGYHTVEFNGGGLSSGIYFCCISSENFRAVKRMILLK